MTSSRKALTLIFIGDSLTQGVGDEEGLGWVGRLANRINQTRELTWYNLGVRGNTTLELSRRAEQEIRARILPDNEIWVLLCIGTNDASLCDGVPRIPHERSLKLIERVIDQLTPLARIFWLGPIAVAKSDLQVEHHHMQFRFETSKVATLNQAFALVAQERNIPYLDLIEASKALDFAAHQTADGIHPRASGYQALYEQISQWPALNQALAAKGAQEQS